jgi:hypothetical protein
MTSDAQHTEALTFFLTIVAAMLLPAGTWEQAKYAFQTASTALGRFRR